MSRSPYGDLLKVHLRTDGVSELTYVLPDNTRRMYLEYKAPLPGGSMATGESLVEKMWKLLDDTMDELAKEKEAGNILVEVTQLKARARGIAECLAITMWPHFDNADVIAREAVRRKKARDEGDTEYDTPGLRSRRMEPPPGTPTRVTAERTTTVITKGMLPAKDIQGIRNSKGVFDAQQVAKVYKTTAEVVESIWAGA